MARTLSMLRLTVNHIKQWWMQMEINICTQSMNITMTKPMESLRLKRQVLVYQDLKVKQWHKYLNWQANYLTLCHFL